MSQILDHVLLLAVGLAVGAVWAVGAGVLLWRWRPWTALVWPAIALAGLAAQIITWGRQGVQLVAYWRDR